MNADAHRRGRALRLFTVLAVLFFGSGAPFPAFAAGGPRATVPAGGRDDAPPWSAMTLTVEAQVITPAQPQAPYDAQVRLAYLLTNVSSLPIYQVQLSDPLVPGHRVRCGGGSVINVLSPDSSVECSVSIEVPPGTYTSRAKAFGWLSLLLLGLPVEAHGRATFTVAAPSPPPTPPATPSPSSTPSSTPTPTSSASVATPSRSPSRPSPSAPAPSTAPALPSSSPAVSSAATEVRTPAPGPSAHVGASPETTFGRPALAPAPPAAGIRRLSTHTEVLLLLLPAAVGAAVAGAAAARRR
jgi:hypothetical protein